MRIKTMLVLHFVFAVISLPACNAAFPTLLRLDIFSNTTTVSTIENDTPVFSPVDCDNPNIPSTNPISRLIEFYHTNGSWEIRVNNSFKYTDIVQAVTTTTNCTTTVNVATIPVGCTGISQQTQNLNVLIQIKRPDPGAFFCTETCEPMPIVTVYVAEDKPLTRLIQLCMMNYVTGPTFEFKIENDTLLFKVIVNTGLLQVELHNNTLLDYDKNPEYILQIKADGYNSASIVNVTVKVTDVDDLGVEFTQPVYLCSMTENNVNETCHVTAHDMDKGINAPIRYQIQSVWPKWDFFSISQDGTITSSVMLDRENQSSYTLSIAGYQADRPLDRVNFTTVEINVADVDDNPPVMKNKSISVNLQENAPTGTFVVQVFATDADEGQNGNFTFDFPNKSESSNFTIESTTGIVRVGQYPPDRETLKTQNYTISMKVFANSVLNKSRASNETTIVITILDVNDNSPQFHGTTNFDIYKTQSLTTSFTKLNVTDADDGPNGKLTVALVDTSTFNVTSEGELYLVRSLNETFQKTYVLTVRATDMAQSTSDRRTTTIDVTVNVTDVNIHTPNLIITRHLNISEDSPLGTVVAEFTATDDDPDDQLVFHILNTSADTFDIRNNSITTKTALDREETSKYAITLVCNDSVHVTNQTFTINILDVNDNVPQFQNGPYNFSVDENKPSVLVGVKAIDADEGENSRTYFWIDKDSVWAGNITINSTTGEIRTIGSLDREVADQLSFTVFVSDHGKPSLMNETVVTVHVLDVNDNPPVFVTKSQTVTILENTDVKDLANISQVKATDADIDTNIIVYSIRKKPNEKFWSNIYIDNSTGVIFMETSPKLSSDCQTSSSTKIFASNKDHKFDSMDFTLTITDVNDNPPIFPTDLKLDPVVEPGDPNKRFVFRSNNSEITKQLAEDDDCDVDFKTLHYWMKNTDDRFQINSTNGFISLRPNTTLDFDLPVYDRVLNFTIFATDGFHVANMTVQLNVTNAIDFQPVFLQKVYECDVDENYIGATTCDVALKYPENNDKIEQQFVFNTNVSSVKFSGGGLKQHLNITGNITDFETQQQIVIAVHLSNPMLQNISESNCTVIMRVLDVNDVPPEFHMTSDKYNFRVKEANSANLTIGFVNVTDKDSTFTMELTCNGTCNGSIKCFDVRANGDVLTTHVFDYETDAHRFDCIILANDTVQSVNRTVTIMVENINDNYPKFEQSHYTQSINETHEEGKYILQIHASDLDVNDTIAYKIAGGNSMDLVINNTTGVLSSNSNFSGPMKLNIVVEACDNGTPQLCNYTDVVIDVLNVNNHAPVFSQQDPIVEIYENSQVLVAQLEATDRDDDNLIFKIAYNTSAFKINGSSLYANNVDAEDYRATSGLCVLLITVSDGLYNDSTLLNITILDVNEFAPIFGSIHINTEINETLPSGSNILNITTTDDDLSNTGFVFVLYNNEGIFSINDSTGEITLAKSVDHAVGSYNMTVVVHDNGHPSKSNSTRVTVTVKDVNEPPSVNLNPSTVYLSSDSPNGTPVASINATDPDSDDNFKNWNFSISVNSTENPMFVKLNMTICTDTEYLIPGNHSLNLTVMDGGGLTAWNNIHVVVYKTKNYTKYISVNEMDKGNFSLANESSGLESRYSIEPSVDMGKFTIVNKTLVMTDSFDREDTENVTLILHGVDVHSILVSIIMINVTVNDINDCVPELDERYEFSINDDTENNTVVTQISARDRDVMPQNRNVSYSIHGIGHDAFSMSSDGRMRITSLQLHGFNEYKLTLQATDGVHNKTAILNITIVDTNDHSPVFTSNCTGPFTIAENVTTGTTVGELLTSDLDAGQNGNVTYSINAGNDNLTFSIETDRMHGIIKTNRSLDREIRDSYVLTIVATDHALLNPRMSVCSVVITVLDMNDNTPRFLNTDGYKGSIAENSHISTILDMHGALNAMDPDEGLNGTDGIVYRIVDNNLFLINPNNGTISLNGSLDREKHANITLTVMAADSNGTGNSAKTTVVIEVIDVNDNSPLFENESYSFNVTENINSSEVVGVVNASDIDGPGNNNIRYRIVSGDFGRFYIDSLQGNLYAAGNIDREYNAKYNLNVSASDGTFSNFTSVTIHVNDVNDNAPKFEDVTHAERIYIDVNESITTPVIIYRVHATDYDESNTSNSRVQYELVNNKVSIITIDNTTGEIAINGPVDREKQDAYTMYVSASDCGNPALSSILVVEIHILDINDNAPIFHNSNGEIITSVNASIIEESPVGSVIALLNATDLDAGQNGLVNYLFEPSSAVSDLFQINKKNGIVQLKEPIIINSLYHRKLIDTNDTNNVVLNMTVIARDSGIPNKSSQLNLFVNIEPINDNAPVFPKFLYTYSVLENSAQDTFVGQCEASIRNESISHMTYSLMEKFDSFEIDSYYGNITTTRSLDRESKDMYMLTVRVTDGRTPERTAFAAVNVTVQDVNDIIPQFKPTETELTVPEETFISRNISVGASDRDFGINAALTYYLEENNDTRFAVDNTSGVLFLNGTFDYEHQTQYNLTVVVRDGGNPQFNNSKTIVLLISDVNDNYPIFHDQPENCSLEENLTIGTKVISVIASDADSGWNGKVFYRILDDDNCPFSINFLTGEIQTGGPLDYEQRRNCTLTVQASDMGTPPLTANMTLTVNILDVYDVIPRFERPVYQVTLNSSYSKGTQFVTVNSSGSGLHYSLKDDFDGLFQIADDGVLSLAKDISEAAVYRSPFVVTVSVTDQLNTSASCLVIVRIVKEEAVVPGSVITSYISEATSIGGLVADVNTTAEIAGEAVQYSIISVEPADSNGMFNITSNDGKVYFYRKLDRETHQQYVLNISFQHAVQQRTRRSVTNSGSFITLVVSILDENDNKPEFVDVLQTIDIPYAMGANKNVTRVKAIDCDIKTDTEMTYFIIGGDNQTFSINNVSGVIETRVPVATRNSNSFHLTILARNGPNENDSAQANVTIQVKPTDQVVVFTVKQNVSSVWKNIDSILGNMSDVLLDIEVKLQSVQPHIEKSYPPFNSNNTDAARTDLFIYGVNKTSREIVSREQMRSIMQSHITELNKKLGTLKRYDPSAISNSQLAIIAFAIAIFFGALIAIVFALFGWSRYEEEVMKFEQFREQHDHHEHEDYELSTIGSRQASQLSSALAAASAVNPVYAETMLSDSFSQLSPKKKKETVYETQEVTMEFRDEHLDIPPASTGESARSIVDSGVGTTSGELDANPEQSAVIDIETPRTLDGTATGMDETDDAVNGTFPKEDDGDDVSHTVANVEKTGPVMTSSPRASRPLKLKDTGFAIQFGQGSENSRNDMAGSRDDSTIEQEQSGSLKKRRSTKGGVKFVSFVDIGETETDDEFDNEDEESVEEPVTEEATEMSAQAVRTDNAREEDAEQLNEVSAAQSSIINQSLQLSEGNAEALAPTIRADDDQKSESRKHVHFTGIHESSNNAKSRSEDNVDDGDDAEYKMTSF